MVELISWARPGLVAVHIDLYECVCVFARMRNTLANPKLIGILSFTPGHMCVNVRVFRFEQMFGKYMRKSVYALRFFLRYVNDVGY